MFLVNLFDIIFALDDKGNFFYRKFKSIVRLSITIIANKILPIYFNLSNLFFKHTLENSITNEDSLVVSLTSFPDRINKVWLVIECMLRQSIKPNRITLWLSKEQFDGIDDIPKNLINYLNKGLEIYFVDDDIKSHKKYYYVFNKFPNSRIILIDDDIFYPSHIIRNLLHYNTKFPENVICHRAKSLAYVEGILMPYINWPLINSEKVKDQRIFFTTGGATLFPPYILPDLTFNLDLIKKMCFNADDIWLNAMIRFNNKEIVKTNYYSNCLPVLSSSKFALQHHNLFEGGNDIQISKIIEYFKAKYRIDIFTIYPSSVLILKNLKNN